MYLVTVTLDIWSQKSTQNKFNKTLIKGQGSFWKKTSNVYYESKNMWTMTPYL